MELQPENGCFIMKGSYVNDNKQGLWLTYYESGELFSEINFNHGKRDGFAKGYSKEGKLLETTLYKNEEIVK